MLIGYARISKADGSQVLDLQIDEIISAGVQKENIYQDEAATNDGQKMLAVNDLFIGPKTHTSARYQLCSKGKKEIQSSSGIYCFYRNGVDGLVSIRISGCNGCHG